MVVTKRIYEANLLFGVAVNSTASIQAPVRAGGQLQSLVSVVFSVVAVEAFLNEATEMALRFSDYAGEPQVVPVFAECMVDAEKSRASLESKFALANWVLVGKKLDKGTQPYQDFALMVRLRDRLLHFKGNERFDQNATAEEFHKPNPKVRKQGRPSGRGHGTWIVDACDRDQSHCGLVLQHGCSGRRGVCFQSSSRCVAIIFGRHPQALQSLRLKAAVQLIA